MRHNVSRALFCSGLALFVLFLFQGCSESPIAGPEAAVEEAKTSLPIDFHKLAWTGERAQPDFVVPTSKRPEAQMVPISGWVRWEIVDWFPGEFGCDETRPESETQWWHGPLYGRFTHMGNVDIDEYVCWDHVNQVTLVEHGFPRIISASNGDQLFGICHATSETPAPGFNGTGFCTFEGGTGRFENAVAWWSFDINYDTRYKVLKGEISSVGSSK